MYVCMYVCLSEIGLLVVDGSDRYRYVFLSICLSFRALRGSSAPDFGQDEAEQLYLMECYESTMMGGGGR